MVFLILRAELPHFGVQESLVSVRPSVRPSVREPDAPQKTFWQNQELDRQLNNGVLLMSDRASSNRFFAFFLHFLPKTFPNVRLVFGSFFVWNISVSGVPVPASRERRDVGDWRCGHDSWVGSLYLASWIGCDLLSVWSQLINYAWVRDQSM